MKARFEKDKRTEYDKLYDTMWNKLCREARLSPMQKQLVAQYLRAIIAQRIVEVESAVDMSWLITLIEKENYGTDVSKGATKLMRDQQYACDIRNRAFSNDYIDGNGTWHDYDNCGSEHLKVRLSRYGVTYDTTL
jgi:hypothetical protein